MKSKDLLGVMSNIDDKFIEEADIENVGRVNRSDKIAGDGAVAACLIDDKFIEEAGSEKVGRVNRVGKIIGFVAAAACLCVAVVWSVLLINNNITVENIDKNSGTQQQNNDNKSSVVDEAPSKKVNVKYNSEILSYESLSPSILDVDASGKEIVYKICSDTETVIVINENQIEKSLGQKQTWNNTFTIQQDTKKQAEAFKIKNLSEKHCIAVRFDDDKNYYLFVNDEETSSFKELVSEYGLRKTMKIDKVKIYNAKDTEDTGSEYQDVDINFILDVLSESEKLSNEQSLNSELLIKIDVSVPIFLNDAVIYIYEDGSIYSTLIDAESRYKIDNAKAAELADYIEKNCKAVKTTPDDIKQEPIEDIKVNQKIVLIYKYQNYAETPICNGFYINGEGQKVRFDFSKKAEELYNENDYIGIEDVFQLLMDTKGAESEAFLSSEDILKCYNHLTKIKDDYDIDEKSAANDAGSRCWYGVLDDGKNPPEFILLSETGDWERTNTDDNAKQIMKIIADDDLENMHTAEERISELTNSQEYKDSNDEQKRSAVEKLLKELENEGLIEKGSIMYDDSQMMFSFQYKGGILGGIMLKEFDPMMN